MNDPSDPFNGGPYPPTTDEEIARWAQLQRQREAARPGDGEEYLDLEGYESPLELYKRRYFSGGVLW